MIVKVQISLNDSGQQVLLYNQSRSIMDQFPVTSEIRELMGDSPKRYFEAELVGDEIRLLNPVPVQGW